MRLFIELQDGEWEPGPYVPAPSPAPAPAPVRQTPQLYTSPIEPPQIVVKALEPLDEMSAPAPVAPITSAPPAPAPLEWRTLEPQLIAMRRDNLSYLEALESAPWVGTTMLNTIRSAAPNIALSWRVDLSDPDALNAWLEAGNRFSIQSVNNYIKVRVLDPSGNQYGLTTVLNVANETDFWAIGSLIFGIATGGLGYMAEAAAVGSALQSDTQEGYLKAAVSVYVKNSGGMGAESSPVIESAPEPVSVYTVDDLPSVEYVSDVIDLEPIASIESLPLISDAEIVAPVIEEVPSIPDIAATEFIAPPQFVEEVTAPVITEIVPPEVPFSYLPTFEAMPIAEPAQLAETIVTNLEPAPMFEELSDNVFDSISEVDYSEFFNPADFTQGESIAAVSDAQNVDYGGGLISEPASPYDFADVSDVGIQTDVLNGTPETPVNDYGSVDYGYEANNSALKNWASNQALSVAAKKIIGNPTNSPSAATQTVKTTVAVSDAVKSLGALWKPTTVIAKETVTKTTGQLAPTPKPQESKPMGGAVIGLAAIAALFLR